MSDPRIDRLFLRDEPAPADLGMVFGYHVPEGAARRASHAANLYLTGLVPRLLFTGGGGMFATSAEPESRRMARIAVELGVPDEAILVEGASRNTFENALRGRDLLRERGLLSEVKRVLLVSCPWHMGRVVRIMKLSFPAGVELLACPHADDCTAQTWQDKEDSRRRVLGEAELVEDLIASGVLPAEV